MSVPNGIELDSTVYSLDGQQIETHKHTHVKRESEIVFN